MPKVRAPVHILQHLWFHWRRTRCRASGGAAETCAAAAWVRALGHSTPFLALLPGGGCPGLEGSLACVYLLQQNKYWDKHAPPPLQLQALAAVDFSQYHHCCCKLVRSRFSTLARLQTCFSHIIQSVVVNCCIAEVLPE